MPIPFEDDPLVTFTAWFAEAQARTDAIPEPTAATLATVDALGMPDARIVLVKAADARGFLFYTNLESPKARQLDALPHAALCFYWGPLDRQVRIRGRIERVSDAEADAYFASRPKESQIGAWASKQSQPLVGRFELEKRVAIFAAKYAIGKVPRPEFWSGYRLVPEAIEFWLKRPYRLHERLLYTRTDDGWDKQYLYP
ncbi:MAG TPA: pyridoxamine 5'-phosphate oxidase [Candidatus Hydrogenedentes bacterium]|nr:pyridoxamine 5'-phosphate oxidase [Candidatus Hydrogenedentota bacterium]